MPVDFDEIFRGGRVPSWLRAFSENPSCAVEDLLVGRVSLGHLSVADPVSLLLDWLEGLDGSTFPEELDRALADWIDRSWGNSVLESAGGSAKATAEVWRQAADLIATDGLRAKKALGGAAEALRVRVVERGDRAFLDNLHFGRTRDPAGRVWLALARHQKDRGLLDNWWRLCALPPEEPWYRGAYGIQGLRGMPAENGRYREFPEEIAEGLLRLAKAFARRVEGGWLDEDTARKEFLRTARITTGAYPPLKERFESFWRERVDIADDRYDLVTKWLRSLVPKGKRGGAKSFGKKQRRIRTPDLRWADRARAIAQRLRCSDAVAVDDARRLISEQDSYADATGNTDFAVRSLCNFAESVSESNPDQALEWARHARDHDPWNAYSWTTAAMMLLKLDRVYDAYETAVQAVLRFPENVVARTALAETLKAQERHAEAEGVYREATERFPDNVVARTGLAETLKAQERYDESEAVYRETLKWFPSNAYARTGLDSVLRAKKRRAESDDSRLGDYVTSPHEGGVPKEPRSKSSEPETEPCGPELPSPSSTSPKVAEPLALEGASLRMLVADAYVVRRWYRKTREEIPGETPGVQRDRARGLLERLAGFLDRDATAAGAYAMLKLRTGDLEEVLALLRASAERFPGNPQVQYALARAEREAARRESRRLNPDNPLAIIQPWRRLGRMNEVYFPVSHLGEGRAWLAQLDGSTVEDGARNAFGKLGRWICGKLDSSETKSDDAALWWAREVQGLLFENALVRGFDDVPPLDCVRERLVAVEEDLDDLEEDWVLRTAPLPSPQAAPAG